MTYAMNKGKFIVIEGGEGSGKGSNISYLRKNLPQDGSVIFTREPGGTYDTERIRKILLHPEEELLVETQLMLFNAARAQHMARRILPAILSGKHVICDRFDASTFAYQLYALELDNVKYKEILRTLVNWAVGITYPNLCIFLDVDPVIGLERARSRGEKLTHFDAQELGFHEKVRRGYLKYIPANYPGRSHVIVDANQPLERVCAEVLSVVKKQLNI